MALTKAARSKILSLVQQAKNLLIKEVEEQLQQYYGIRPDGTVLMTEQLTTVEPEIVYTARLLRQRLNYVKANLADKNNQEVEAIRQLVREQAFTILNRFASLRMAEERGIIKETIRKEYNSEGFQVFDSITGQGQTASQYIRYKWYLYAVFDELALDLPAVFDRYSPYALIFPSEQAMNRLLAIINKADITLHREEGLQPINLWKEDETIGWIYQYYNSREEITAMREASSAPRNSQELAVRNQFFTPRYVVQFLTDNSLGRIWYEMTGGNTILKTLCPYLIMRPGEMFLKKGESKSKEGDGETQYIEYRAIKDPREILMLDPACGSMHFGLYCFDLFEHIYKEAWDNYPELLTDLRNSMTRQAFIQQIPELIIRYNIHGVDIDPRALQIAGLSLWLRAQKSFDKQNLSADQRPQITRSNLVLAEPLPGSVETLRQLVQPLDAPMRKLVLTIWDKMKLAGETGLLLRIEEEIDQAIKEIVKELGDESVKTQLTLGGENTELQVAEQAALYATKRYRDQFLDSAELEVLKILSELSETATNGDAYQKLLFADDTARGFAFIELCRKKYDVIGMNPPFGVSSINSKDYIDLKYPESKYDLASVFVERMHSLIENQGLLGAITTRNIFFLGSYQKWRNNLIINNAFLKYFADLGGGVLDAMVETAAYVFGKSHYEKSIFIRATKAKDKDCSILKSIKEGVNIFVRNTRRFHSISNQPLCYWVDEKTTELFEQSRKFLSDERGAFAGLATTDNSRFCNNFWEILPQQIGTKNSQKKKWFGFITSEASSRFIAKMDLFVNWKNEGLEIKSHIEGQGISITKRVVGQHTYFKEGVSWAYRTSRFEPHIIPAGFILSSSRYLGVIKGEFQKKVICSLWNSQYFDYILKLSMEWITRPKFINGVINQSPYPALSKELQDKLANETLLNHTLIGQAFKSDETSLYFQVPAISSTQNLYSAIENFQLKLQENKSKHLGSLEKINKWVYDFFAISTDEQAQIHEIVHNDEARAEGAVFEKENNEFIEGIFSWLLGCVFGRWDVRFAKNPEWLPVKESIFSPLPACSPGSLINTDCLPASKENIVSKEWLAARKTLENMEIIVDKPTIAYKDYPIEVFWTGIGVSDKNHPQDIIQHIRGVIKEIWGRKGGDIEQELAELLGVKRLEDWLNNPNKFFDSHINQYTQNKRTAPIYWPISTASGSYTIWVYYPNLNDQSLYKIVSDFIIPKKEEVADDVKKLDQNSSLDNNGKKLLKELQDLLHELQLMEKELIEVAALPYKPNHDDGVLITAAPLHKFFKHNKWRSSTEACWKALEKGEYDWAHLAYSIWPDRVTKKCKKNLSLAIAHGLEEICEVKPKENKEMKAAKPAKKNAQGKLID